MKSKEKLISRIYEITYKHKLSHLSSCLSALPILMEIYQDRKDDEVFILSNGHAGLALYVLLEDLYGVDAEELLEKHGIHPSKDLANHLYCSTGSLGSGLPIAVGHALANRNKDVFCMISDGECGEGSIWEAVRFAYEQNLTNLHIYVNINGMSATDFINVEYLKNRLLVFNPNINIRLSSPTEFDFAKGLVTHYHVLNEDQYNQLKVEVG
jgi:transketolase